VVATAGAAAVVGAAVGVGFGGVVVVVVLVEVVVGARLRDSGAVALGIRAGRVDVVTTAVRSASLETSFGTCVGSPVTSTPATSAMSATIRTGRSRRTSARR
jgi:hypothetical protein